MEEKPIRRVFCWAGFSFLVSACAASFLSLTADLAVLALGAFLTIIFRFVWKQKRALVVSLSMALAFAWITGYLYLSYYPVRSLAGHEIAFTGVVEDVNNNSGRTKFTVNTQSIDAKGAPQRIRLTISGYDDYGLEAGDLISGKGQFFGEEESSSFEQRAEERARGIEAHAGFVGIPDTLEKNYKTASTLLAGYRQWFSDALGKYLTGNSLHLMRRMLFGIEDSLDTKISDTFRLAGMSAILSVSGMHMVAVSWFAESILSALPIKRKRKVLLAMGVVVLYAMAAGLGMSVLRSGLMMLVRYFAVLTDSDVDSPSSLAFSASVVVLLNPAAACDCGFLMSVMGSLGIITCSLPLAKLIQGWVPRFFYRTERGGKLTNSVLQSVGVTVSAWTFTTPVCAAFFGTVCFTGLLSNLIAGPVSMLAIYMGIPTALLSNLPVIGGLGLLFAKLTDFFSLLLIGIAEFFSEVPYAIAPVGSGWVFVWMAGTAALFLVPKLLHARLHFRRLAAILSLTAFCIGFLSESLLQKDLTEVRIVPLKDGAAISCKMDGGTILITEDLDYYDLSSVRRVAGYYNNSISALVSTGIGDAAAEVRLVETYRPKVAVLSDSASATRMDSQQIAYPMELQFDNGDRVVFYSAKDFAIETENAILLYYSGGCDIMEIDAKYRRPDIAVIRGVPLEELSVLRCNSLVILDGGGVFTGAGEVLSVGSEGLTFYCRKNVIKKG